MKTLRYGFVPALALILAGCGAEKQMEQAVEKPASPVQAVKAETQELVRTMEYTGSVEPFKVARMASPAEGPIVTCAVREGDQVEAGQFLARVGRSAGAKAGEAAAKEELNRQQSEFERVGQLVESGSLAGEQLDMARANLKKAEAQWAAMQMGAGDYEITAPWAGVVSKVWIAEGNYVAPRAPLVEIYDPASLVVRFSVPEREASLIRAGQEVAVTFDAFPGHNGKAEVTRIYPELDRGTRSVTVEAGLSDNTELLAGMFARVNAPVNRLEAALVIPEAALVTLPNGDTVVFVAKDEKAVRRKVSVAMETRDLVAIADGIAPGEMVIVRGQDTLKDGATIKMFGGKPGGQKPAGQEAKTP